MNTPKDSLPSEPPGSLHTTCSAAAETVEQKMWVELKAPGFNGRFMLPDGDFNELLAWLVKHSCGQEKQPNADVSDPRRA